jgi:hypothetical protein
MTYVFDTSSFRVLDHYFPARFPTFWEEFNRLITNERIISVREVRRELENQPIRTHLEEWVKNNRDIFLLPEAEETEFIRKIFSISHFQQMVSRKNQLRARPVADPFVIASAQIRQGCVVTEETYKPNAARIPNVCEHFEIDCISLEVLMEREGWSF